MGMGKSTFDFTNSSITIDGGSTTINITRDNQSYSHKLSHGYGEIATLAVGTTSYTWAPTAEELSSFLEEIPNQTTRLIDVYLDTYNGSTLVGRYTRALTVTLSEDTGKPTVNAFLPDAMGGRVIIPGKTDVIIDDQSSAKYGAKKLMSQFVYDGNEYADIYSMMDSFSSQLTTTKKLISFDYKVIDTRRFSNTQTMQYNFAKYTGLNISSIKFERCDSDGTLNSDGEYAKVTIEGTCCTYGTENYLRIRIRYSDNPDSPSYDDGLVDDIYVFQDTLDISKVLAYGNTNPLIPGASDPYTSDSDAVPITFSLDKTYVFSITFHEAEQFSPDYSQEGLRFEKDDLIYISPEGNMTFGSNNNGIYIDDSNVNIQSKSSTSIDSLGDTKIHGNIVDISSSFYTVISGYAIQNIPVYISGDCNDTNFAHTCKVYIGNNGTHKPDTRNGWLETIAYYNYCYQTYTTYDGMAKYERIRDAGVFGEWKIVYRRFMVSNNTTGTIVYLNPGLYEVSSYEYTTSSNAYRGSRQILYSISEAFAVTRLNDIASTNAGLTITTATATIAGEDDPEDPENAKTVIAMTFKNSAATYTAKICIKQLY